MDSSERTWVSERRRSILQLLGVATGGGVLAESTGVLGADGASSYRLVQGGECRPLEPLSGDQPVEELYAYQLPAGEFDGDNGARDDGGPYFSSLGTRSLQRHDTSLLFLYDGPDGLSLVVVHGKQGASPEGGGSATFEVAGLPADGSWVVKDDYYLDPETGEPASTNYDRWRVDGSPHRIDWTWGSRTDGGAFRDLGRDFEVTIDPAFNDAAALYEQHYEGDVTAWQALSGSLSDPDRHSLDTSKPVTIAVGSCDGAAAGGGSTGGGDDDGRAGEQKEEREGRKEEREERKHERKQKKHERKEERKEEEEERKEEREERKHERKQKKHERKAEREEQEEEEEEEEEERKEQKHERKERKHERKEEEAEQEEEKEEEEEED